MSNRKLGALLAVPLITILVLSGCVQGNKADPGTPVTPPTSTSAPADPTTPPSEPLEGDLNGDGVLDGWEKDQLLKNSYTLPDGTTVPLPKSGPLTPEIEDSIAKKVLAKGDDVMAAVAVIKAENAKLGRLIVPVSLQPDRSGGHSWAVGDPAGLGQFPSKDAAVAAANAFAERNPQFYVVVVLD